MSDIQYVYPLILNKVTPPHYVTPTLRRPRLLEWLNAASTCRAVVIAADAGYGKTTLLWQWEREVDFPVYWYKLDRNDRDWTLHISYLIEAVSQRHPGFGLRAHSMLQQLGGPASSRPGVAAFLMAEMHEHLTEPCTFIIDDWQFVASVTEVRGLWNQILRDAPPTCRFVFLSRAKPQLQFARFKTHSGYAEVRTDALRFTDHEIDDLFRDIYQDPLSPTELAELERRTEGWAASLQLVEVSLRERPTPEARREFIQSINATTDSDLFAFLAEEVLDQQAEAVRNFLLSTSILAQIDAELAERLAGIHDGAQLLADLEQRGLFTYRLDPERKRYRYHGLFRDFLERRLIQERTDGEVTGLHIHAASYYETHEQWPQAIHHYLKAGLTPQAARLIARYGEDVVSEGRLGLVDEWLHQLPAKTIRDNARLSLLWGEAIGIRGDWEGALAALQRARTFFARKGDRRMEALACLKLSTVYSNRGQVDIAAATAVEGLALAPLDAFATRLRLTGNLAITSTWMNEPLSAVTQACRRIAVEAKARGLEHFAAIALHNLGVVMRQVGEVDDSIQCLERAAAFWADLPSSPFADNAELVLSLLLRDDVARAELLASTGVLRTAPWPRPFAEARYGQAAVLAHQGRFTDAIELLRQVLSDPEPLGPTIELVTALLVECLYLTGAAPSEIAEAVAALEGAATDPRQASLMAPVRAIAVHVRGNCNGECLDWLSVLDDWEQRGAHLMATIGGAKVALLALDHRGARARRIVSSALRRVADAALGGPLRWWLLKYRPHAKTIAAWPGGFDAILGIAEAEPGEWAEAMVAVLAVPNVNRSRVLAYLSENATPQATAALSKFRGADIAELRRVLLNRHAPTVFIRAFGPMSVHVGAWSSPPAPIERRRTRSLLALLIATFRATLTREMAADALWPDADAEQAINSLNQTVFQLRRVLDPSYRDGDSPQYLISTVDIVQLNPEIVATDLDEIHRLRTQLSEARGRDADAVASSLVDYIRGEFLADVRYEDWAGMQRTAIHAEVRQLLLPVAEGVQQVSSDIAIRAACALLELDPYDESALLAMSRQLEASGRRVAARDVILGFIRKLKDDLDEKPSEAIAAALARWPVNRGKYTQT